MLMDKYIQKAYIHNPLIRDLIEDYKIAPQLDEGHHCHGKAKPTPLGLFKRLPPEKFKAVAYL